MLKMAVFGLLQTLFFLLLLKTYLNLSWSGALIALLTIFALLFSRVWYLVKDQKRAHHAHEY
jgi:hypothetical protein